VLATLNEIMLRQRCENDDHKFCTVTYTRLETERDAKHGANHPLSRRAPCAHSV
jgi:hypothetical protein